ncbi:hypothetical protein K3495_g9666 [Podosphaera aphanis]|nr:hypothetical protein K3495_g9666 [Podosphaera aphanis]
MASHLSRAPSAPDDSIDFASEPQSPVSSDDEAPSPSSPTNQSSTAPRPPSLRPTNDTQFSSSMSANSTHIGLVNNARRPNPSLQQSSLRPSYGASAASLPESMEAKMRAFHLSRQGTPARPQVALSLSSGPGSPSITGSSLRSSPIGLNLPNIRRPSPQNVASAPVVPKMPVKSALSARRGMKLPGGLPAPSNLPGALNLSDGSASGPGQQSGSMFNNFSEYVDTKNGTLKFAGKAVIHGHGINFTSGSNFSISLDEVDTLEELGKGNYGTVYKVRHARPVMRRPGLGLAGNKLPSASPLTPATESGALSSGRSPRTGDSSTGIIMAMKEIRLELDEAKFAAIIMELDILHRCVSPYIIDFYGAFFQEGAVYICIEYMDGGSIDKIYGNGIPENILKKIAFATIQGLKTLKDDHNIIHRDVKPTNILVNTLGQVKICDFGVSGNLVASIAKTNIGCQSYMAPERISGCGSSQGPGGGTYSVQSDIWSMGLSIIECALGKYPYPPETYNNIFSQLSAIVEGEPPGLPKDTFSPLACEFVRGCLNKKPKLRPTYSMLLQHEWLAPLSQTPSTLKDKDIDISDKDHGPNINNKEIVDQEVADWVTDALERKKNGTQSKDLKPALHTAPINAGPPSVIRPG